MRMAGNTISTARSSGRAAEAVIGGLLCIASFCLITLLVGCSGDGPLQPYRADMGDGALGVRPEEMIPGNETAASREPGNSSGSDFELEAKYSYVRSSPGGGGLFIVRLNPGIGVSGDVHLSLEADPILNASLDKPALNSESRIAEITIRPSEHVETKTYRINVVACCPHESDQASAKPAQTLCLEVEIIPWCSPDPTLAEIKRDELVRWVQQTHPEFGDFFYQKWYPYITYPGILVVEHWTFLSEQWEMRICFHAMIPPYDWSKILLRERGEWYPVFAAMREHDGTEYVTHEIPISDYPMFYGY